MGYGHAAVGKTDHSALFITSPRHLLSQQISPLRAKPLMRHERTEHFENTSGVEVCRGVLIEEACVQTCRMNLLLQPRTNALLTQTQPVCARVRLTAASWLCRHASTTIRSSCDASNTRLRRPIQPPTAATSDTTSHSSLFKSHRAAAPDKCGFLQVAVSEPPSEATTPRAEKGRSRYSAKTFQD